MLLDLCYSTISNNLSQINNASGVGQQIDVNGTAGCGTQNNNIISNNHTDVGTFSGYGLYVTAQGETVTGNAELTGSQIIGTTGNVLRANTQAGAYIPDTQQYTSGGYTMTHAGTTTFQPNSASGTFVAQVPANSGTLVESNIAQTFVANQVFINSIIMSSTGGYNVNTANIAGGYTATLPALTGYFALTGSTNANGCAQWASGILSSTGAACGTGGGTGLSGMTAGQVPVAATASTVTSSIPIAGGGSALTSGPTTTTTSDVAVFNNTTGQLGDSGKPLVASGTTNGQVVIWNASAYGPASISGAGTLSGTGVLALTATGIQTPLAALASCTTGTAYSPFSSTCISVGGSITNYQTSGNFTRIGPGTSTPTHTLDLYDPTASTGTTNVVIKSGAGQTGAPFVITDNSNNVEFQINAFGNSIFNGPVSVINSRQAVGPIGVGLVFADTNALATTQTAAIGSSGTPTVLATTFNGGAAIQTFDVACYMNTKSAVAASSVSLFLTWTDDVGVKTSSAFTLATTATANYLSTGYQTIEAKAVPFTSSTNIGYYTTITGSPQYGIECKVIAQ